MRYRLQIQFFGGRGGSSPGAGKTVIITSADGETKVRLEEVKGVVYRHSSLTAYSKWDDMDEMPGQSLKTLIRNAKNNGATVHTMTKQELKAEAAMNKKREEEDKESYNPRASKKGVNRHRLYWSAM